MAQYSYFGRTSNLVTGYSTEGVSIIHKRLGTEVTSDTNGAFSFNIDSSTNNHNYQILFNIFFAPRNSDINLSLYTLSGKVIFKSINIGQGGSYKLPQLISGVYILQVISNNKKETLKLFSSGSDITILQNLNTQKNTINHDTLLFSKDGFYNAEVVFPRKDTVVHVKLLSKNENDLDYLLGLPNYNAFNLLQGSPFVTNQGEIESVKFIYDKLKNVVYYMNSKKHKLHYYFSEQFLDYHDGHYHFNTTQYSNRDDRYLYPGSINYYKALDKYVLRFYAGDQMQCSHIADILEKIQSTSYLHEKLYLYSNSTNWDNCSSVPTITSEELYDGQNYQALNLAKGYGFLKKVDIDEFDSAHLDKHDIVLLNGIPNDVSVVAGIITTEFQTPLSHINVLSHNRGTPNMALRDAWNNPKLEALLGKLIFLEVLADSFIVREATLQEANTFWTQNEPQITIILEKDVQTSGLIELKNAGYSDVKLIGGKAANFAELLKVPGPKIQTPENSFAIPFFYYDQHIRNNHIEPFIQETLSDDNFKTNQKYREDKLEELRDKIKQAPIDNSLVELVRERIDNFNEFSSYRFRSSTNAEDLEFFSGAGLYDSKSAKKDHETKTIENTIKKVWASLWNFRAFEEREYYKIDHGSTAMGILVHRSFPDEDANGVIITKNLYNINPGFVINVQFKEFSIVFPEPGMLHDQIILYSYSLDESSNFTIEYLSHSNVIEFEGQNALSVSELHQLGNDCMNIKRHFFNTVPNSCNCNFDDFGLDIEFKIDSPEGKRKLYIKQVRLYN